MKILLLSQEEPHPFYEGIHSYFTAPLLAPPALPLDKLSAVPLGITLLASELNRLGFETVPLYNFFSRGTERARLVAELEAGPFAVGVSTTHLFSPALAAEIYALIGRLSPGSRIIAGGPGAEWNPALRPAGGITVFGPGERTLPRLLAALKNGEDLSAIPNLAFFRNGAEVKTGAAGPEPLEEENFPDWGLYPEIPSKVPVQGSRGCARACGFCSYNTPFSARNPGSVLAEIRANRDRWGIRRFRFTDSDFAADPQRALEICRGLKADGGYGWTCFTRADGLLAPGLPQALRQAGCLWVFIGAESGSAKILDLMNKGCGPATLRAGIAAAKQAGLGVHGNFVIGYPGETRRTLAETEAFAAEAGLDTVYFSPFQIRSLGIPALSKKQAGLSGGFSGWAHSTMTSSEMLEYVRLAMERAAARPGGPLLGSEALFSLFSQGEGAAFGTSVRGFFTAVRDWNLGQRGGDEARKATARKVLASHL